MNGIIVESADFVPYGLPMPRASTLTGVREGVVLQLRSRCGLVGQGDAAPLPGFSPESWVASMTALSSVASRLRGQTFFDFSSAASMFYPGELPGSASFALEQALVDLFAQRSHSEPVWILASRLGTNPRQTLASHALVADAEAADAALRAGYRRLKVKVGRVPLAQDLERLREMRATVGDQTAISLDANGAWSPEQAPRALDALAAVAPAFIEQPLPADTDVELLAEQRATSPIPIALDESARDAETLAAILAARAADYIVLKPMLCGGLLATAYLARLCERAAVPIIVTSLLESRLGCAATIALAATIPGTLEVCGITSADPSYRSGPLIYPTAPSGPEGLGSEVF